MSHFHGASEERRGPISVSVMRVWSLSDMISVCVCVRFAHSSLIMGYVGDLCKEELLQREPGLVETRQPHAGTWQTLATRSARIHKAKTHTQTQNKLSTNASNNMPK